MPEPPTLKVPNVFAPYHLHVTGLARGLARGIKRHAHAGRADRMAQPDFRPPDGLTGSLPSKAMEPSSTAFQASPGAVRPKCSMAMYSSDGEAVMRLYTVQRFRPGNLRA